MTSTNPSYPIREAFRQFYPEYLRLHPSIPEEQRKTASCIMKCKTGELGYDISFCNDCGHVMIHAVSCNNRSCPCCQAPQTKKWELERNTELIEGISYFHVVFTVPHELNTLIRANQKLLLNLMFKCVHATLLTLCKDENHLGAKPGIVSVLHTWGQKLSFHPHIHVCISGGGLTPDETFVETKHKGFFLPVGAAAKMFRGKYLSGLKKLYDKGALNLIKTRDLEVASKWQEFIDILYAKKWMPFIKETFNGRGNAIRYLARYSFRTAISNSRIIEVTETHVTFKYKDYADGNKEKYLRVKGTDFIGMFLQHILPKGFNRVRFSGYLANSQKTRNLKLIHKLRHSCYLGNSYRKMGMIKFLLTAFGTNICKCPKCSGTMLTLPRGMPINRMPSFIQEAFKTMS